MTSRAPIACLWLALWLCACPGTQSGVDAKLPGERARTDGRRESGVLIDLQTKVGEPCTMGHCGPGLICMANVCCKMCTEPLFGCNDKTAECPAGEACIEASSFSGACVPVTAKYQEGCQGAICEPGTLCVTVSGKPAKCYRLCKYGCATGFSCQKVSNGCEVCI